MSASPNDKYAQREADREDRLRSEKEKLDKSRQKNSSTQREEQERELEAERMKSKAIAEQKKAELTESRLKQTEELAKLETEISSTIKNLVDLRAEDGKKEVEMKKAQLEKRQKELEFQANLRREQLTGMTQIMKTGEQIRQDCLNELRASRKKEQDSMNEKILELNQKLHEARIAGEERLQKLDEKRNEEQKQQLQKKERIILNGIANSEALSRSMGIEDSFGLFKQDCKQLINRHRAFRSEYDTIAPQLIKMHERMKKGKALDDYDMEELLSTLRVFNDLAQNFSAEGSTSEDKFQELIGNVIELGRQLMFSINSIKAKMEDYEEEPNVVLEKGIGEELVNIADTMKELGVLMQQFNVIGRDHLQETLAIQMKQAHSSRSGHSAIEGGPPAYESGGKKAPLPINDH